MAVKTIGMIGLGKMGSNLAFNLTDNGYDIIGYNRSFVDSMGDVIKQVRSLEELIESLPDKKIVWVMVPSGEPTREVLLDLSKMLPKGSIVLDGGNTNYKETIKHAEMFKKAEINFLEVGTSGGIEGARHGACLMIGGEKESFLELEDVFANVSTENGYMYAGRSGSGHFLKMVHNGIEYGMMQAIGEGLELLKASDFDYDMKAVTKVYNHGSVIRGWLMELMHAYYLEDVDLEQVYGIVDASGEAEWTIEAALEYKVPVPVISSSLFARYRSQQENTYSARVVAALRNQFGGHKIYKDKK